MRLDMIPADATADLSSPSVIAFPPGAIADQDLVQAAGMGDYPIGLREADTLSLTIRVSLCDADLRSYVNDPEGPEFSTTGYDTHSPANETDNRYWYFGHYGRASTLNLWILSADLGSGFVPMFAGVQRPTPRPRSTRSARGLISKTIEIVDVWKFAIEEIQNVIHPVYGADDVTPPAGIYSGPSLIAGPGYQYLFAPPALTWGNPISVYAVDGRLESGVGGYSPDEWYTGPEWIRQYLANVIGVFVRLHARTASGVTWSDADTIEFFRQDTATTSRARGSALLSSEIRILHSGIEGLGQFSPDAEHTFAGAGSIWDWLKDYEEGFLRKVTRSYSYTPGSVFSIAISGLRPFDSYGGTHSTTYGHGRGEAIEWEEAAGTIRQANANPAAPFEDDVSEHSERRSGSYSDDEAGVRPQIYGGPNVPYRFSRAFFAPCIPALSDTGLFYFASGVPTAVHGSIKIYPGGPASPIDYNPAEPSFDGVWMPDYSDSRLDPDEFIAERGYVLNSQQTNSHPRHLVSALLDLFGSRHQCEYEITLPITSDLNPNCIGDTYPISRPDPILTQIRENATLISASFDWIAGTVTATFRTLNPEI